MSEAVEYDFRTYLLTDATLKTLIGWAADDPKIYPVQAPEEATLPYILYAGGVGDVTDETLKEDRIQITVVSDDLEEATDIRNRLNVLLDQDSGIQATTFYSTSNDYYIYNCRLSGGGQILIDQVRSRYHIPLFYSVIFHKK